MANPKQDGRVLNALVSATESTSAWAHLALENNPDETLAKPRVPMSIVTLRQQLCNRQLT